MMMLVSILYLDKLNMFTHGKFKEGLLTQFLDFPVGNR